MWGVCNDDHRCQRGIGFQEGSGLGAPPEIQLYGLHIISKTGEEARHVGAWLGHPREPASGAEIRNSGQ